MLTLKGLRELVDMLPISDLETKADVKEGVPGNVLRGVMEGRRVAVVGTSQSRQVGGLMDLVHLHLVKAPTLSGRPVDADEITFIYEEDSPPSSETEDILRTLAASTVSGPWIRLMALSPGGDLREVAPRMPDFRDASLYRYTGWPELLLGVAKHPPALMTDVIQRIGVPAYRAYPMLAAKGAWSLRLDGLQVGKFKGTAGRLSVGKLGKLGHFGPEGAAFLEVAGHASLPVSASDELSISDAADVLKRYASRMLPETVAGDPEPAQNEHALESRILRGLVPLTTRDGVRLALLQADSDPVNWGSQFPTRWGRTAGGGARYLDAMLRDGSTPWAVEIKVDKPALGVRSYYRHAVAQAVLYREFIRTAAPLREWFAVRGLNQRACRAAVVVPEFRPEDLPWDAKLEALCDTFDVELIRVPRRFAGLHNADPA